MVELKFTPSAYNNKEPSDAGGEACLLELTCYEFRILLPSMHQAFSFSAPRFTDEDEEVELAAMTEEERENVHNDLYGTHVEVNETEELRETCLAQMQQCLDEIIPDDEKQVYLEACQVCPELVRTESAPMRFLRSENYNPEVLYD